MGTAADLARWIAAAPGTDDGADAGDDDRLRMCIGWVTKLAMLEHDDATAPVGDRPPPTGDSRWDAMIAGLVEHLASHEQLSAPEWVYDEDRFLTVFWFPVDLPSIRVSAFRDAPRRWPDVVCSSTAGTCTCP